MEVVTGALPSVITKLGELLVGEYNLQKGVKGEIRFLKAELESMKGALEKVSSKPADQLDIQDKIWAKDLRELSYDIEDTIDTFMVRGNGDDSAKLHGINKFIDRSVGLFRKVKIRHGIATEIRDIRSRVVEVHERRRRYDVNLAVDKPATATVDPRLFSQYTEIKELVGIDETRDELIKILMQESGVPLHHGKIVSIVGFGGLGKTTLAKAVYEKIRALFDCCAFVSVSQTPDLKKLFKGLLYNLGKEINEETLDESQLIDMLREFLKPKRYFIVIDDIWDISVWKAIRNALPDNDGGYIIITTTRNVDVAKTAGGVYELKRLSENNSRKLLYRRIFGSENNDNIDDTRKCPDKELVKVSDRILKKCAGVPLAIITMAGLLASKSRNKMDWYEVYNSIGTGLQNNLDLENMRKILSLSYYNMPSYLRTCLLYLSVFPEDFKIEKDRLIKMWIAEGFILCDKQGKSPFELGESYFNELINRSMIQPMVSSYDDSVNGCRVHDMVLDLICSLSSEANFVTILNGVDQITPSCTIRRLSLQNGKEDNTMTSSATSFHQVRSLVVQPSATSLLRVFRSFQVLRVLDLQGCDLSQSSSIKYLGKNLIHLRYLGLRGTRIVQLPEEIGNLQFLQILDTWDNEIACLPSNVVRLKHLMCLNMDESTRVPKGIGSLTSLEKLSCLGVDDSNMDIILEELGQLTELRVLVISMDRWNSKMVECLSNLQKIQVLCIFGSCGRMSIEGLDSWVPPSHLRSLDIQFRCWFSTLPAWMKPSLVPDLSELSISIRELKQVDLDILGSLQALRSLELEVDHGNIGIRGGFVVGAGSFPCLVYCRFWGFVGPVVFQQGAMPRLRTLRSDFSVWEANEIVSCDGVGLNLGLGFWGFVGTVVFQRGAMPRLRTLCFALSVWGANEIASCDGVGLNLGLGFLPSLQEIQVWLDSEGARKEEVEELKAALRHATKIHPNHPELYVVGYEDTDEE